MSRPDRPRARAFEAFPWKEGTEPRYALKDPEGLVEGLLVVSPPVVALLVLADGTRTRAEIARDWAARTGERLPRAELDTLLAELAEGLVLEGPAAAAARAARLAAYRAAAARPASCAGGSYPEEPEALAAYLDARIEAAGSPPMPARVTDVLAPHIDLRGGGPCHGAAALAYRRTEAEVFVVIGTAHAPIARPFALTTHDFDTPLGRVPTDRALVRRLAARGGGGLLDDELAHRDEHSVEFQALWLRHVLRERPGLRIVPVLAGSIHASVEAGRPPTADAAVADFVAALRELRRELGSRVAFVASVDFAHVGPRYGDPEAVTDAVMAPVLAADRRLLACAAGVDPAGWLGALHAERDRFHVCGASPTWTLLSVLEGTGVTGSVLRHDAWEIDRETGSRVSFAAVAYGAAAPAPATRRRSSRRRG